MKKLLVLGLLLGSCIARADGDLTVMTCHEARQMVRDEGAVVLWSSDDIYDRYVSSQRYCYRDQHTEPAWVKTTDRNHCFVGYVCRENMGN